MNDRLKTNMAISVRNRLLALARDRGEDFQLVLTQYGLERLLFRLGQSPYRDRFILKGAMLFTLWDENPHRPTRDVDFLGFGDSTESGLQKIFRKLCAIPVENDGLKLLADSVDVETIRDETEYGGMRVKLIGNLAGARIPIQADVGFGDTVTPEIIEANYPTLLNHAAPHIKTYPRETVVAEKYQAMVLLGMVNSRMKDFYDLWIIASRFRFEGATLTEAIGNTFSRRNTKFPLQTPTGLRVEFYQEAQKNAQWNAFLQKNKLITDPPSLMEVSLLLEEFLMPPTRALISDENFPASWDAGGPWKLDID